MGCYHHAKLSNEVSVIEEAESFANAQNFSQSPPPGSCPQAGSRSLRRRVGVENIPQGIFKGGERESERFMRAISFEISRLSNEKGAVFILCSLNVSDENSKFVFAFFRIPLYNCKNLCYTEKAKQK